MKDDWVTPGTTANVISPDITQRYQRSNTLDYNSNKHDYHSQRSCDSSAKVICTIRGCGEEILVFKLHQS